MFGKQSLVPTYPKERVVQLIRHVHPSGRLLLLRARASDGRCIATGLFPAMNKEMYFWGGASWRPDQRLRPNEPLMWYAMRYWKARGVEWCDLAGGGEYKRRYGATEVPRPVFMFSRWRALDRGCALAKRGVKLRQIARGRLARVRT